MIKFLQRLSSVCFSVALVYPLALASGHWHLAAFISLVMIVVFIIGTIYSPKISTSILSSIVFGAFLSIAFWALSNVDIMLSLQKDLIFMCSFFVLFAISTGLIFALKPSITKKIIVAVCNLFAVAAFVLLVLFADSSREYLWLTIVMGALIGLIIGSITSYAFDYYINQSLKVFHGLADYINILVKPFFIFFLGYLLIALIFAGFYNVIYAHNPASIQVPANQESFLDFLIYSLDTMTTVGNSITTMVSVSTQIISMLNVFISIIWMTIMLAATIAYASESFKKISEKHKGENPRPENSN